MPTLRKKATSNQSRPIKVRLLLFDATVVVVIKFVMKYHFWSTAATWRGRHS